MINDAILVSKEFDFDLSPAKPREESTSTAATAAYGVNMLSKATLSNEIEIGTKLIMKKQQKQTETWTQKMKGRGFA